MSVIVLVASAVLAPLTSGGVACAQGGYQLPVVCGAEGLYYGQWEDEWGNTHETSYDPDLGWVERGWGSTYGDHYFSASTLCSTAHRYGIAPNPDPNHPLHEDWDTHWEHAWIEMQELAQFCGTSLNMC